MGHIIECLTYPCSASKSEIQADVDEYANANGCWEYLRGRGAGQVRYMDRTYESYEQARAALESSGAYVPTAVKFKKWKPKEPTATQRKKAEDLNRRIKETQAKAMELSKPHYASVQSKFVKCANCGSSLATAFCGKSWVNSCPVCRAEMRPATIMKRLQDYQTKIQTLQNELLKMKKEAERASGKYDLCWCVYIDLHV